MHFSLFYTILNAAGLFPCRILRCFEVLPWLNSSPALPSRLPRWAAAWPRCCRAAFTGGLGAGKTAFCRGLAEGLGCTDPVSSPTFAIVNYYRGPRPMAHFDLYRIHTENDLAAAGFYDYLDQGAVVAAEWSENFAALLAQEDPIRVDIQILDQTSRKITIEGVQL